VPGNGSEVLAAAATAMRAAANGGMTQAMGLALRGSSPSMVSAARSAARSSLPRSGGLADLVADSPITSSVHAAARTAVLQITATSHVAATTDEGYVEHRTFGRGADVRQSVQGGWFSDTLDHEGVKAEVALEAATTAVMEAIQVA
jgi:hypothetical protein